MPEEPVLPNPVAPVRSAKAEPPVRSPEIRPPAHESVPPAVQAEERARAKPAHETRPHLASARKTARRERTVERRKALAAVRRFDDSRRDIRMNAYAAESAPRLIIIRPTSIQDVYYYSARPWQ
jgi:hypothetical protein